MQRFVALGASNLARGLLAFADAARAAAGGPVVIAAALGRGRSYGVRSRLLGRELTSIGDCGLWPALAAAAATTANGELRYAAALLMDVGNDILYGFEPDTILGWVDRALQRLRLVAARCVVAGLPLASMRRLGRLRFVLVRSVLVPSCRLSLATVVARAERVDDGLRTLAARHRAEFRPLPADWYGFDPVHFRASRQRRAFAALLDVHSAPPPPRIDTLALRCGGLCLATELRSWSARARRAGPLRLRDGSTIELH
jgi:hypothetical protein